MDISSINSKLTLQEQLDILDQEIQQIIVVQQDANMNNVQATQLDAFATSTIQPSNS